MHIKQKKKMESEFSGSLHIVPSGKGKIPVAKIVIKIGLDIKNLTPQAWSPEAESKVDRATIPELVMVFLYYILNGSSYSCIPKI